MARKPTNKPQSQLPSVLAFQRGMIITDGIMENITRFKGDTTPNHPTPAPDDTMGSPVQIIRHGIRGTQASKSGGKAVSNIQQTESAKTSPDACGLAITFSLRVLPLTSLLFACNDPGFRKTLSGFIEGKLDSPELREISRRYARNILNGSWLWRNEILGTPSVEVWIDGATEPVATASNGNKSFRDGFTTGETELGDLLCASFRGLRTISFKVIGKIAFGFTGTVEVYPSQNMLVEKPKGFARSLYKVNVQTLKTTQRAYDDGDQLGIVKIGEAAIRDQKIGNAIRKIDTWYDLAPDTMITTPSDNTVEEQWTKPTSIEPSGASIELDKELRSSRNDAIWCLQNLTTLESLTGHSQYNPMTAFILAVFIRGAVLSNKKDKDGDDTQKPGADE